MTRLGLPIDLPPSKKLLTAVLIDPQPCTLRRLEAICEGREEREEERESSLVLGEITNEGCGKYIELPAILHSLENALNSGEKLFYDI